MFKTKGGAGGQRLFEQCSKKLQIWWRLAPLINRIILIQRGPNNQVIKSTNLEIFRADLDYGYDNIHNQTYDFVPPHPLPPITTPRSLKQETGFDDFKVQMANLSTIYHV